MQVAVLGCGPAGLLAAHALKRNNHEPIILSKKVKSTIFGAQYLHRPIPGITSETPDFNVHVWKIGTKEGYAEKVYGDRNAEVSWDSFHPGEYAAWDMRQAYDKLWEMYDSQIFEAPINGAGDVIHLMENYPVIFCSIPRNLMCRGGHEFKGQPIQVLHGHSDDSPAMNEMIYNGSEGEETDPTWYRFSNINGYRAWEYREGQARTVYGGDRYQLSLGIKPLSNKCDCWPSLQRIGRFGKWEKGELTHHAFEDADIISSVVEG